MAGSQRIVCKHDAAFSYPDVLGCSSCESFFCNFPHCCKPLCVAGVLGVGVDGIRGVVLDSGLFGGCDGGCQLGDGV